jgi:predicted ATPase
MSATIHSIKLNNFKRFETFYFSAQPANILVGPNNSGKSSILDALRVAYACLRYTRSTSPKAVEIPGVGIVLGYQLPMSSLPVPIANIATNYSDEDATIEIRCSNGNHLFIRMNPERPIVFYATSDSHNLRTSKQFREALPINLIIVPPLGPFEEVENFVTNETIQRNESSRLSNRYFRNIWLRRKKDFSEFSEMMRTSWPGIDLKPAEIARGEKSFVQMFYTENRIDRELYWSGFGFQIWLQILTHILRGDKDAILIIDEPDIYLHPDLQRKLLHIVRKRFSQFFMATHSVEIINEAESRDVVSINPTHKTAKRISSEDDYQALFNYIGSYENIDFSRLARAKRIVFFEGKDRKLLRKFALKIGAENFANDTDTTVLQAGGFGQWRRVKEVAWTFQEILKLHVEIFAIFDRDYRSNEEVDNFLIGMKSERLACFVLRRKEIENYALTRSGLISAIRARQKEKLPPSLFLSEKEIVNILEQESEALKHDTFGQIVGHKIKYLHSIGHPKDAATISKEISIEFQTLWLDLDKRLQIISGKDFISALSTTLQKKKGFSLTTTMIVDALSPDEIAQDLKDTILELDKFCVRS